MKQEAQPHFLKLQRLADEDLISLLASLDGEALRVLYHRHSRPVYSLIYRIVGQAGATEDICQETFLAAWHKSSTYQADKGSVRSWILTIAHRKAIDYLRAQSRSPQVEIDLDGLSERKEGISLMDSVEAQVIKRIENEEIKGLLDQIPIEQKRILELAYYSGFSQTEIAEICGLSLGTVKGRMRLGLRHLRDLIEVSQA